MKITVSSQDFPISGEFRVIMLGLEFMIAYFCFQFAAIFIVRYFLRTKLSFFTLAKKYSGLQKLKDQVDDYLNLLKDRELAWGSLFFMLGFTYIFFIVADFYTQSMETREIFLILGYAFYICGFSVLSYSLEKNELRKTRFLYTKLLGIILIGFFFSVFTNFNIAKTISSFSLIISIIAIIHYGKVVWVRVKGLKKLALPVYSLFFGFFLLLVGFLATTDQATSYVGTVGRLLGDLTQFFAITMFALSFYFLPSFSEFDWVDKIKALFVVHPSGISLFNYNFQETEQTQRYESDLTTGAIVAIKAMMQDMSAQKKSNVQSIRKENFTMLLEYGKNVICVLLADQESVSLREKIESFCQEFEKTYQKQLEKWYGKVDYFNSATTIVEKIFSAD